VDDRDDVRRVGSEIWLSAKEVKRWLAVAHARQSGKSTAEVVSGSLEQPCDDKADDLPSPIPAEAAAELLEQHLASPIEVSVGELNPPKLRPEKRRKTAQVRIGNRFKQAVTRFGAYAIHLRVLTNRWVILGAMAAGFCAFQLSRYDFSDATNRRIYAQYVEALAEFRRLQSSQASDAEWNQFQETQGPLIQASMDRLQRIEHEFPSRTEVWRFEYENGRARYTLFRTGEELRDALRDGKKAKLAYAEENLKRAQDILAGNSLDDLTKEAIEWATRSGRFAQPYRTGRMALANSKAAESETAIDPLFMAFTAAAVLIPGGALFLWRKAAKRRSRTNLPP
jgi:hypothetical protein